MLLRAAKAPGLSAGRKECGPALALFPPYLPIPRLRLPSSARVGNRGLVLHSVSPVRHP